MIKNVPNKKRTFVTGVEINNTEPSRKELNTKSPKTAMKRKLDLNIDRVDNYKRSVSKRRVSYLFIIIRVINYMKGFNFLLPTKSITIK